MEIRRINNEIITLYNYDPVGNVTYVYSEYPWKGAFDESFCYDEADQLTNAVNDKDFYNLQTPKSTHK